MSCGLVMALAGPLAAQDAGPTGDPGIGSFDTQRLLFKGLHNAYYTDPKCVLWVLCERSVDHDLRQLIDDWGVWLLELDFGVDTVAGVDTPRVGHDRAGQGTRFHGPGYLLTDFLDEVKSARALAYRPVFFKLESKPWGRYAAHRMDGYAAAIQALEDVFGPQKVYSLAEFRALPLASISAAAGAAIYFTVEDRVTEPPDRGRGEPAWARRHMAPGRFLTPDKYKARWTFEYSVPPNPIVVDADARGPERGTYSLPYATVAAAAERAAAGTRTSRRAASSRSPGLAPTRGPGWTLLLRAGRYPGPLKIDEPMRIEATGGVAVIG